LLAVRGWVAGRGLGALGDFYLEAAALAGDVLQLDLGVGDAAGLEVGDDLLARRLDIGGVYGEVEELLAELAAEGALHPALYLLLGDLGGRERGEVLGERGLRRGGVRPLAPEIDLQAGARGAVPEGNIGVRGAGEAFGDVAGDRLQVGGGERPRGERERDPL